MTENLTNMNQIDTNWAKLDYKGNKLLKNQQNIMEKFIKKVKKLEVCKNSAIKDFRTIKIWSKTNKISDILCAKVKPKRC